MKNLIIVLLTALLLPLSPTLSAACSGIRYHFIWTEPKLNSDNTLLTNLAKTTLYYSLNSGVVKKKDYTATKPTGGGAKSAYITINMNCETKVNSMSAWATATNLSGIESAKGNVVIKAVPALGGGPAGGL